MSHREPGVGVRTAVNAKCGRARCRQSLVRLVRTRRSTGSTPRRSKEREIGPQARIIRLPKLAVHLAAVTDARHKNDAGRVVDFVNDPVVPNTNTERLETG